MIKSVIYMIPLLLIIYTSQAQVAPVKQGKLFVENYLPKTYQGDKQIWAVVQDQQGLMYFGHDKGLVQYDGVAWRHLMPKEKRVRSMAVAKDGTVYIGSSGDFGYLAPNKQGYLKFVSLLPTLPAQEHNFSDIWKTVVVKDKVYFVTLKKIYCYQNKQLLKIYSTTNKEDFYHFSFAINDQLWQPTSPKGIAQLKADSLHMIKGSKKLGEGRIYTMLPYDQHHILMVDALSKFWLYDTRSAKFTPFAPSLDKFLGKDEVYSGTALPNGQFALGTRTKGVVIINKQGQLLHVLGKAQGLVDNTAWDVYYQSGTQNLWVGTDKGISKITIGQPLVRFDASHGLEGSVEDVHNFKGKTYVSTSVGAFTLTNGRFNRVKGLSSQTWDFYTYNVPNSTEQRLLVGNNRGAYALKGNKFEAIVYDKSIYSFQVDHTNPQRVYMGLLDGFSSRVYKNGKWEIDQRRFGGVVDPVWQITQDAQHQTWVTTRYKGVGLLEGNQITLFDSSAGLPPHDVSLIKYRNKLYYCAQDGIYTFDQAKRRFKPDLTFDLLLKTQQTIDIQYDVNQIYWLVKTAKNKRWVPYRKTAQGYQVDSLSLKPIAHQEIYTTNIGADGMYWLATNEGLFRYNAQQNIDIQRKFTTLIRKVQTGQDSLLHTGNRRITSPTLAYANNSLMFEYAALYFNFTDKTKYSYQLVGYDKQWAKWTSKTQKEYTNLNEGTYTFRVKARNLYGIESNVATFSFKVLPPWHRTWWAYTLFGVLVVAILFGGIKWYTHRLRRQKAILEHKVSIRTQEVVKQKEEIYQQNASLLQQSEELQQQSEEIMAQHDAIEATNKQLNERNYQITQSIRSAKTIQAAILPFVDKLDELVGENFVLFRPRDVVSGDFYYLEQVKNTTIVAAIDCTGHGVPGAFMSLIGYALLNEIIYAQHKINPAQILEALRKEVRYALKQEQTKHQHGMDVAMLTIEHTSQEEVKVVFAGAKRPLWYITPNNPLLQEIKGSNVSIGIEYANKRPIAQQSLLLPKGTIVYLGSDGFADQNNKSRKKFGVRQLKELLTTNSNLPLAKQQPLLEQALDDFMLGTEQRDDILLMGIRL